MMAANSKHQRDSFSREFVTMFERACYVWTLTPIRYRAALASGALLMAFTSALSTAIPILLGLLVDNVQGEMKSGGQSAVSAAWPFLAMIGSAYLLRETLHVARRFVVENACTQIEKYLTVSLVSHLLKIDLASLTGQMVGALHSRMSRSINGGVRFLRSGFLDFFPLVLTGGFAISAALAKQPWLAVAMSGVIPISLFLTMRQLKSQKDVRLGLIRGREELDGTLVEQLSGIEYIRAAGTHTKEVDRVMQAAEALRAKEIRHHVIMSLYGCAKALNEGLFHVIVLSLAVYLAAIGSISFGDILTFSMLFFNVMVPLNEVHRAVDEGHENGLFVGDLVEMLDKPEDRSFQPVADHQPPPVSPIKQDDELIAVKNLQVDYVTSDGCPKRALNGVSLSIPRGRTIGLTGRSGCGKTTLVRALLRLVHPNEGSIFVEGIPIDGISRPHIGKLIGYVGQSPFVFAGTIAENIAYETEDTSPDAVRRAAQLAGLDLDIMAMPRQYDTMICERGQNLSGGQRQRLALARVFLKNPPVLILDEATSALDSATEDQVQQALSDGNNDRTILVVAHRLTTLKHTDSILVFENGQIVESGPFEELLRHGTRFQELTRQTQDAQINLL